MDYEMENMGPSKATGSQVQAVNSPIERKSMLDLKLASNHDTFLLARLGKKQVLKRNFGFMTMVAFSCTILVTWEGVYSSVPDYVKYVVDPASCLLNLLTMIVVVVRQA